MTGDVIQWSCVLCPLLSVVCSPLRLQHPVVRAVRLALAWLRIWKDMVSSSSWSHRFCLLWGHDWTREQLKKVQNPPSFPSLPEQTKPPPQNLRVFWKHIWHGRRAGLFLFLWNKRFLCSSWGCLGKPDTGICRVAITPCMKGHSLHCQYVVHLCTELQIVREKLSLCWGSGVPAPVSQHC